MKVGDKSEVKSKHQEKAWWSKTALLVVSDSTGSCLIMLWQNDVEKQKEGCCYKLTNMLVRQYAGVKYLSMSECGVVNKVADIGEVVPDSEGQKPEGRTEI